MRNNMTQKRAEKSFVTFARCCFYKNENRNGALHIGIVSVFFLQSHMILHFHIPSSIKWRVEMSSIRSRRDQSLYLETSFPCWRFVLASISNIKEIKEIFILTQIFCSLSNDIDIMEVLWTARQRKSFTKLQNKTVMKRCTRGSCHQLTLNKARTWRIIQF